MRCPFAQWVPWRPRDEYGRVTYYEGLNSPIAAVLHIAQGYMSTARQWALEGHYGASWHYTVGRSGEIMQHLEHGDGGYHAGITDQKAYDYPPTWKLWKGPGINVNHYTIGIEHEGFLGQPWTEAQRQASKKLVHWLADVEHWPLNEDRFPPHAAIDLVDRPNDFDYPGNRAAYYEYLFEEEGMASEEYLRLVKAIFGTEARIDELADNLPVEGRLARLESNDGPIGKRLSALEDRTHAAGNILSEED